MILLSSVLIGLATAGEPSAFTVRPVAEVQWSPLNAARGDASPRAANLWGDRTTPGPSGFLVRFADGFASPPHIHNVSYRAVVLSGEVHNDDAGAAPMWMVPGSFWTQPRSEAHITSSRGPSFAYVEIDDGPYLVHAADQAEVPPAKPINLDASNLVWTAAAEAGVEVSRLWGAPDEGAGGVMLRVAPKRAARITAATDVRAVVVAGTPRGASKEQRLSPGSLLSGTDVPLRCEGAEACLLYVRTDGGFTLSTGR